MRASASGSQGRRLGGAPVAGSPGLRKQRTGSSINSNALVPVTDRSEVFPDGFDKR